MTAPANLLIPLAGLLAEPAGTVRHVIVESDALAINGELTPAAPIAADLDIARTNRGLFVDGTVTASLAAECARCLGPARIAVTAPIAEEVLPSIDPATGRAVDPAADPEITRLTDHHELDLEPLLRDAVTLSAPIAPLCTPDCPGLCIECGERLGDGHRAHVVDDIDPRLAALRGFQVDGGAENE